MKPECYICKRPFAAQDFAVLVALPDGTEGYVHKDHPGVVVRRAGDLTMGVLLEDIPTEEQSHGRTE